MSEKSDASEMKWPLFELARQLSPSPGVPAKSPLDLFLEYTFEKNLELYPAQEEAILEIYAGKNVILNTPTGSGKSLVATAMHFLSLASGRRSIYTCPIKALVNEKFLGLCQEFGPDQVGMITGDATVNPDAPIICCTAEILSNVALRLGSETPYSDVIMDEFHYYSDRERGVAWQIPLLSLQNARFLLMSATLGDTDFFEKAITELTGAATVLVRSTLRPVPLDFEYSERPLHLKISQLIEQGKYPVYLVNFTQRDCAEEAQKLLSTDYCTKEEKRRIQDELEGVDFKSPYGKEVQRFLKHGVGIHHAGLLPRYRILVEKLAQKGVLKIISGTDTLGVGVNVPIRTVLFTKLCKFDGQKTTILSVRDFQQISGRAGRKGFDSEGSVVVQAPEHVIENLVMDEKAAADPKKAKKQVKRKPPEKGYLAWNKDTLTKLRDGKPEPLTSRFQVSHGMLLNVLSRPGTKNCEAVRDLISRSHESDVQKKRHRKFGFQLFRSLVDRQIIELNPLRVNLSLQQDFSLNQTLSLYLIDTLKLLDPSDTHYAVDVLTLVESILENPELILRRQVDRLKTWRMQELKEQGMEFNERIEELEKVEHPKPNGEFIYRTFNEFSAIHPWVGQENIRPKSVAREMFETFQTFHDYIREYELQRVEGLLLRYLTEVYKVLVQTVPETAQTDDLLLIIDYFGEILRGIDSSLLDEWERIRHGGQLPTRNVEDARAREAERERIEKVKKAERVAVRNEVLRGLRHLRNQDFAEAAQLFTVSIAEIESRMKEYSSDHQGPLTDAGARAPSRSKLIEVKSNLYRIEQTLTDLEGHNDWQLILEADMPGPAMNQSFVRPKLRLLEFRTI